MDMNICFVQDMELRRKLNHHLVEQHLIQRPNAIEYFNLKLDQIYSL